MGNMVRDGCYRVRGYKRIWTEESTGIECESLTFYIPGRMTIYSRKGHAIELNLGIEALQRAEMFFHDLDRNGREYGMWPVVKIKKDDFWYYNDLTARIAVVEECVRNPVWENYTAMFLVLSEQFFNQFE